jgi:serine/threonine protein kinase
MTENRRNTSREVPRRPKRSISCRTESLVDAEIEKRLSSSRILKVSESNGHVAAFEQREVEIGKLLGEGSFAEVHEVKHFHLASTSYEQEEQTEREHFPEASDEIGQCRFAVKYLKNDLIANRHKFNHAATSLVIEARFLAQMDHPNIIKLRGWSSRGTARYGDEGIGYFLILDKIEETLAERIDRWEAEQISFQIEDEKTHDGELEHYSEKISYALQISSALEYLHGHDIIYRDLKPANIGFKDNKVQLFDFGIARELPETDPAEDDVFCMTASGSRRYMAPEIFLGQPYNLKADVFSFAIVFQQMLSLETPFAMYNPPLYKLLVCEEGIRPTLYPEWPDAIQDLLEDCWSARLTQRPSIKKVCKTLGDLLCQAEGRVSKPADVLAWDTF